MPGLLDFVGADGSPAQQIEAAAPIRSPVSCATCHAPKAELLDRVTFPSGVTVKQSGPDTVCLVCHMGRESGDSLGDPFAGRDPDAILTNQSFINIHYAAAAAALHGAATRAGYQYPHRPTAADSSMSPITIAAPIAMIHTPPRCASPNAAAAINRATPSLCLRSR